MSDIDANQKAQQNLSRIARLLASSDYKSNELQRISLAKLDATLAGMDIEERLFIKSELRRAGVITG